jgi:hypothetical protein
LLFEGRYGKNRILQSLPADERRTRVASLCDIVVNEAAKEKKNSAKAKCSFFGWWKTGYEFIISIFIANRINLPHIMYEL